MIKNLTFFEPTDLPELAGLTHEALWEAGFNLDDMDFGIAVSYTHLTLPTNSLV